MDKVIDLKNKTEEVREEEELFDGRLEETPLPYPHRPTEISWLAPSHSRPNYKFLGSFLTVLGGAGAFFVFIQPNILTAGLFFGAALFMFLYSFRQPEDIEYEVSPRGIRAGFVEYRLSDVKSFWLEYNPGGVKELSLHLKKWHHPYVKIRIGDSDPVHIHNLLVEYIPEVERDYNLMDVIEYHLGF